MKSNALEIVTICGVFLVPEKEATMSENAKKFKQIALQAEPIRLYGRNLMVRDLFRVFSKQNAQKIPLLVLSTT